MFSSINRYVDDIIVFNFKDFNKFLPLIYPNDLLAEKSNDNNRCLNYLDVKMHLEMGNAVTSVYHKVDDFNFEVTTLTFVLNCIPNRMGYNVYGGQLIRYARICSDLHHFLLRARKISELLISRGYNKMTLVRQFERTIHQNAFILNKYNIFGSFLHLKEVFDL